MEDAVARVQRLYPRIYMACHARHTRAGTTPHGITRQEASLLAHLDEAQGADSRELARHLCVAPSTLSAAVKKLERLGHLERERPARDRRRVRLRLTAKGAAAMRATSVLDADRVEAVLGRLGARQRAAAIAGLELLARASAEAIAADAAGAAGRLRGGRAE